MFQPKSADVPSYSTTWWLIPRIVSSLVHPSYFSGLTLQKSHWKNQGNITYLRSVSSSPPSMWLTNEIHICRSSGGCHAGTPSHPFWWDFPIWTIQFGIPTFMEGNLLPGNSMTTWTFSGLRKGKRLTLSIWSSEKSATCQCQWDGNRWQCSNSEMVLVSKLHIIYSQIMKHALGSATLVDCPNYCN